MFAVNDTVLYGSQGICTITSIGKLTVGNTTGDYYTLKPIGRIGSTIYVPLQNEALLNKMRRVLTTAEIHDIIHALRRENALWIENESDRKETYQKILCSGNPLEIMLMIKALYLHRQKQQAKGKKLHLADQQVFKSAKKLLYEEFAHVLQIRPDQVVPFIQEQVAREEKATC